MKAWKKAYPKIRTVVAMNLKGLLASPSQTSTLAQHYMNPCPSGNDAGNTSKFAYYYLAMGKQSGGGSGRGLPRGSKELDLQKRTGSPSCLKIPGEASKFVDALPALHSALFCDHQLHAMSVQSICYKETLSHVNSSLKLWKPLMKFL